MRVIFNGTKHSCLSQHLYGRCEQRVSTCGGDDRRCCVNGAFGFIGLDKKCDKLDTIELVFLTGKRCVIVHGYDQEQECTNGPFD